MFVIILLSTFLETLWLDWRMHGFVVVPGFLVDQESRRSVVKGGFAYPTSAAYLLYPIDAREADHRVVINKLADDIGIPPVTGTLKCRETSPFGDYTFRNAPVECVERSSKGLRYISYDSLKPPANLTVVAYTDYRPDHPTVGVEDALKICSRAVFPNFPGLIIYVSFFGLLLIHLPVKKPEDGRGPNMKERERECECHHGVGENDDA